MHNSDAAAPSGPGLLLQLGRLILRARTSSPGPLPRHKLRPGTSQQVLIQTQPKAEEDDDSLEETFRNHINALWTEHVPVCVEVLLAPSCSACYTLGAAEPSFPMRGLLLERWTIRTVLDKSESPAAISSPWLLNAVRSQLHFSQLAAWRARTQPHAHAHAQERRRKLSREINIKKIEANTDERKLNVVYSIKTASDCCEAFAKPPTDHTFPLTDIGSGQYLKVVLESLPRLDEIPEVACACQRTLTEELVGRLNDLSIGSRKYDGAINSNIGTPSRRLSIISNPGSTEYLFTIDKDKVVDDRMHTPCSESGKHKCNCDDESDGKEKNQTKKLDERRLKEIAKYKRRIRKEKIKFCDSTSSEGEVRKETTSIPILQASRFDRFRAIGCYRNQTYLTLPATRIETKSPFIDNISDITPPVFKTNSVSTQTDFTCSCGHPLEVKCPGCAGMVRSDGNYNLASLQENGARRKLDDIQTDTSLKKQKCDNSVNSFSEGIVRRPKLRRLFPIHDKLEKIVADRHHNAERDMLDLHLKTDDSVFTTAKETVQCAGQLPDENEVNLPQKSDQLNNCSDNLAEKEFSGEPQRTDNPFSMDKDLSLPQRTDFSTKTECNGHATDDHSDNGSIALTQSADQNTEQVDGLPQKTVGQISIGHELNGLPQVTGDQESMPKEWKRQKTFSISDDDYVVYEKCDYGTIDRHEIESPKEEMPDFKFSIPDGTEQHDQELVSIRDGFVFPDPQSEGTEAELDRFRWRFDSAASMVFHAETGLPLTSSPAPLRRGNSCFDFDDSINGISGIKSALCPPAVRARPPPPPPPPPPRRDPRDPRAKPSAGLLGSFEESALQGRLEAVATVQGFTAELGASGAFCPPHRRLPVTVSFYAPGGTAAPYMGHISLGPGGYRVGRAGSVQVSLFNPHGTLVKMFVVRYDLSRMPPAARTFLRQRTLRRARLRYLIHLRFMTSKSGKLYLHTDIRLIVSRKADLDTAAAHSGLLRAPAAPLSPQPPLPPLSPQPPQPPQPPLPPGRAPNRVFGGSGEHDEGEPAYEDESLSYELRTFTYAPDNPKYSPR